MTSRTLAAWQEQATTIETKIRNWWLYGRDSSWFEFRSGRNSVRSLRREIQTLRALRKALGIFPHVTMTHEVGDLWVDLDGEQARTTFLGSTAIRLRAVRVNWVAYGTPAQFTRAGWRRVRDT